MLRRNPIKNRRFFIATLVTAFLAVTACQMQTPEKGEYEANWREDYEATMTEARQAGKPVLLEFTGSDWCPPCKHMEATVFTREPFVNYADANLALIKLDFPRYKDQKAGIAERNQRLAGEWGVEAFPTMILLNAQGQPVKRWVGAVTDDAEDFVRMMQAALPSAS